MIIIFLNGLILDIILNSIFIKNKTFRNIPKFHYFLIISDLFKFYMINQIIFFNFTYNFIFLTSVPQLDAVNLFPRSN